MQIYSFDFRSIWQVAYLRESLLKILFFQKVVFYRQGSIIFLLISIIFCNEDNAFSQYGVSSMYKCFQEFYVLFCFKAILCRLFVK